MHMTQPQNRVVLQALAVIVLACSCTPVFSQETPVSNTAVVDPVPPTQIRAADATPSSAPTTELSWITFCGGRAPGGWPDLNVPSNLRLLQLSRDGSGGLWSEFDGATSLPRVDLTGKSILGANPSGRWLLAKKSSQGDPLKVDFEVIDSEGGITRSVASGVSLPATASWINDNLVVVFDEFQPITLYRIDSGQALTLVTPENYARSEWVYFSPDGRKALVLDQGAKYEWFIYDYDQSRVVRDVFPWITDANVKTSTYVGDVWAGWFSTGLAVIRQDADTLVAAVGLTQDEAVSRSVEVWSVSLPWPGLRTGRLAWRSDGQYIVLTRFSPEIGIPGPNHVLGFDLAKHRVIDFCIDLPKVYSQGYISPDGLYVAWTAWEGNELKSPHETIVLSTETGAYITLPDIEVAGWIAR